MIPVRITDLRFPVTTLGPGTRVGVWFQGCHIGCRGCISRDTWDPRAVAERTTTDVLDEISLLVDGHHVDGVTFSGGEPFEQPDALIALASGLRTLLRPPTDAARPDLLCYSGYPLEHLERRYADVLSLLDAVIPEPYLASLPTSEPWRGSANQSIVPLSTLGVARYEQGVEAASSDALQVEVTPDQIVVIGVPRRGDLSRVERRLAAAGIGLRDVSWRP